MKCINDIYLRSPNVLANWNEDDILKIINKMDSKSSSCYGMFSNKIIKVKKIYISKPLTLLINQMLELGIFSDNLNIVKIIPLYNFFLYKHN